MTVEIVADTGLKLGKRVAFVVARPVEREHPKTLLHSAITSAPTDARRARLSRRHAMPRSGRHTRGVATALGFSPLHSTDTSVQ
jgi:hypothetical protein